MKTKAKVVGDYEVTCADENVFEAIGFPPAEAIELQMRAQLLLALKRWRKAAKITQAHAAKQLEVTQDRVSDIERGKFNLFSLDQLVRLANRAGLKPQLKLAA